MAYNKNLYSSDVSALDAGIIYDQNQQMMQDEINAAVRDGDIVVGLADNLASEQNQFSTGQFIERTTGGDASLSDGDGYLVLIRGTNTHTGYVAQSVEMEITHASGSEITAEIDDDTFLGQMVADSGTFTATFDGSSWDYEPASYGITVTGTPVEDDTITVTYQKEERGTITQSDPQTFVSTGWNLYNHTNGYARVLKYHETYGFGISGTYTALQFSSTLTGEKSSVTVTDGKFSITEDGYIWVTGGNATDTAIWMTWSDWQSSANGGTWQAYTESTVSFASVITSYFPYGLMAVGGYQDEIDFSLKKATQNVGRLVYNSTNLETARSYRTAVDYDEDYIYYGLPTPIVNEINIPNSYAAYDHGIEYFTDTEVEVYTQTLYGINLKNKLERDVLTISQQTLTDNQKQQVQTNLGIKDILKYTTNPNLLDNWYFVGGGSQQGGWQFPINQRGLTSYTDTTYTIDRWRCWDSDDTVVLTVSGVQYTSPDSNGLFQYLSSFPSEQCTISALIGGTLYSTILEPNATDVWITTSNFHVIANRQDKAFGIISRNSTLLLQAVKLELGGTQTLAHQENGTWVLNEVPNYEEQLLRCKTSTADSSDNYANQTVMTNHTVTNPNLFDNWYFVGGGSQQGGNQFPINQRGQTSYTGTGFTIDRWKGGTAQTVATVYSDCIKVLSSDGVNSARIEQYFENSSRFWGRTLTFSILGTNNELKTATFTMPSSAPGSSTTYATLSLTNGNSTNFRYSTSLGILCRITTDTSTSLNTGVVAIKVEIGDTQTLAHQENGTWVLNEIPDYNEQLYRCCASAAYSSDVYANNPYTNVGSIYIGTSEPSNKNIKFWLDTDEPGMSAVSSVNGKTGTVVIDDIPMTLLWTNASPSSSFAAQTVPLALSGYDYVYVRYNRDYNSPITVIDGFIEVDGAGFAPMALASADGTIGRRLTYARSAGVEFQGGMIWNTYRGTSTMNDIYAIPACIYGVKI